MKQRGLKFLSLLLSLVLLIGLVPGISAYAEDYPIFIGNTQVTSDNTSGDGWSYNKDTKTLTLDNFSYPANPDDVSKYPGCIYIGSSSDSITIELKGANTLTNNSGNGIYSNSALIFSGSGRLIAQGYSCGIYSSSNIRVESGNITATSNYIGLYSDSEVIEIKGGTVKANGNNAGIRSSIRTENGIIITGGTVTANAGNGPGIYAPNSSVIIDDGRVTASGMFGIRSNSGELQINGGIVIASGSWNAIDGNVINTIAGTGWTDEEGKQGQATINESSTGQELGYKKVQFPAAADSYTVTYDPGRGSGTMEPTKVEKNAEGKFMYKVESCGFSAPEGETFDYWLGSDGKTYRPGPEVEISADLTLKAQWKEEKKPDGGEKKTSGSGFDLVFNIPGEDNSWGYGGGYAPQQAYRVSLAPMQGGSAALGLTTGESTETAMNVYPTTTVYVFPNAEQGYVLDKIVWSLIDGSASYDITEAKNFVMPAMDVVVYVTFRPVG